MNKFTEVKSFDIAADLGVRKVESCKKNTLNENTLTLTFCTQFLHRFIGLKGNALFHVASNWYGNIYINASS